MGLCLQHKCALCLSELETRVAWSEWCGGSPLQALLTVTLLTEQNQGAGSFHLTVDILSLWQSCQHGHWPLDCTTTDLLKMIWDKARPPIKTSLTVSSTVLNRPVRRCTLFLSVHQKQNGHLITFLSKLWMWREDCGHKTALIFQKVTYF